MGPLRPPGWSYSRAAFSSLVSPGGRSLRSQIWQPTGGIAAAAGDGGHEKLIRAGYIRQTHPGIFHLLPFGLRVQEKIERLLDNSMRGIGASKVALSSITSKDLWETSGRFEQLGSELLRFEDRKQVPYMLSPTHEEEITSLVSRISQSYKDLPLRLYQITRKYRDELRPRHGLLRAREFTMKDLYTFDVDLESAMRTYEEIRSAYSSVFSTLRIPFLVAEASCGDMGGSKSHEYHMPSPMGEDNTVRCGECGYSANEEVAQTVPLGKEHIASPGPSIPGSSVDVWRAISTDRRTLVNVWYLSDSSSSTEINIHAVRKLVPDVDASIEDVTRLWAEALSSDNHESPSGPPHLVNLFDSRVSNASGRILGGAESFPPVIPKGMHSNNIRHRHIVTSPDGGLLNLMRIQNGDQCPRCASPALKVVKTLELGHTFHLGDRYSAPIKAMVTIPTHLTSHNTPQTSPMQMGCYGIGVTRMMGAIADSLADNSGLMWPLSIAPYEVAIVPDKGLAEEALGVYDQVTRITRDQGGSSVSIDVIMDDRGESIPWKLKDADLTGYPIVIVMGRAWRQGRGCEVQCRQLSLRETVSLEDLPGFIATLFRRL